MKIQCLWLIAAIYNSQLDNQSALQQKLALFSVGG